MLTSCEKRMRELAMSDTTLTALLGSNPIRWFDRLLQPGYITKGSCVRVTRISTVSNYVQEGPLALEMIRFQIDALDFEAESARAVARAIGDWFTTVSFLSDAQFQSPPAVPRNYPNFQLNQRSTIERPETGAVYYVESQDWRVFNNSNI